MPIIEPKMSDLNEDFPPLTKLPPPGHSLLISSASSRPFRLRSDAPGEPQSLNDRIAKAQLVAALKQSLRSVLAAKNLIATQLGSEHGGEHGISENAIVLLQAYGYLDTNIMHLETLLSACGVAKIDE